MKPICLALLFVTSVLAAPSVILNEFTENEVSRPRDNGNLVSRYVTENAFYFVDGGDTNVYILNQQEIVNDLADQPSRVLQAAALGQALGLLINQATGIPGDACAAAALNNAYGKAYQTGNYGGVRAALANFITQLSRDLRLIVQLATNPASVKYAVGPTGGCAGGGRKYNFEGAWKGILANTSPAHYGLIDEEYCTAKRLYYAFNIRSNNVGATVTALALPPVVRIFEGARVPAANFLRDLISGRDPSGSIAKTQQALLEGINSVQL